MEFAEHISSPKVDGVILHTPFHEPVDGTLCVTGHHLILSSRKEDVQELWLLHQCIDNIEKKQSGGNNSHNGGSIILKCKDFRIIQLDIASNDELHNIHSSIERLSNLDKAELLYPFFYRPMYNILEDGYTLFQPEAEFAKLLTGDEWRVSHVNKNYTVCPSYSGTLIVPKSIDDDIIIAAATFREGGRFPILSYRHETGAVLLRSSQPLLNNNNKRSRADEKICNAVLGSCKKGYIVDVRSASFVSYCKGKGGGTEPDGNYNRWKKIFKPLDKLAKCDGSVLEHFCKLIEDILVHLNSFAPIPSTLDALQHYDWKVEDGSYTLLWFEGDELPQCVGDILIDVKQNEACNDPNISTDKWLSRIESSNWLTHVQNLLSTACLVAQCLDKDGASVLVHGSSGLDSTLLVTSLAQVILNPDCRTVRGLQALIEREWLQAGHPFQTRHSKFCYSYSRTKGIQPTFLLFLDCVHQLHYQFPYSFEFTLQMLIILFENSYFSQFGTFLGNCESDRVQADQFTKTTSLWSYLNRPDVMTSLLNPMYEPNKKAIWPSIAPVSLTFWHELYLRWVIDQTQSKKAMIKIHNLIQNDKDLRSTAIKMRKQLLDLHRQLQALNMNWSNDASTDDNDK